MKTQVILQERVAGTPDTLIGRKTIKSRCPICDGVINSVPIKYGVKAMMACPHCTTMVVLDVEDIRNCSATTKEPTK